MKRSIYRLLLAGAMTLAATAVPYAEIVEQIVVKVNGEIITKTELEQRQVQTLRQRNQQASTLSGDQLRAAIAEITPPLIVEMVDELLMLQRGRELGFKMSDQQFQSIIEQIRKENRIESDEAFQAALKQEGLTMAELRATLERQMIVNGVQRREVMEKVGLTEEEARKYHADHIEEFTTPGTVTLREILVAVASEEKGVNVATDEEAQAKVDDLRRRATAGEDFAKLAGEVSDAPSRANGGLLGPLTKSELAPPLQEQLSTMKPGEISEPIRLPRGYLIFKLESASEPEVQPAEKVRDQIAERLWERKRRTELGKYLTRIRSEAIIEWKNDELRKAYESAVQNTAAPPESGEPS